MGSFRVDPYLKEAIQVWCLFESLRDCKSKRGMIAAIVQYLQAHVTDSLFSYAYRKIALSDYVTDWSSPDGQDQIEAMLEEAFGTGTIYEHENELVLECQDGGTMKWYEAMDKAFTNWKTFKTSTFAKSFVHLINVVVSSGMCATADLTFKLGNVALFSPMVAKKQLAATDVFEAFYEAVAGFMKGGWRVYKTGEVSAFFFEDEAFSEFDDRYNEIRSWHGYAIAGNLREYTDIDDNEYDIRLRRIIEAGEALLKKVKPSQTFEKKYLADRTDKMRDYLVEFTQLRVRGGLRIAPFAVCLFGQSGCGKSSLTNLTINAGLVYNDLSAEKDRIATWADNDKFASSVRSHINAIVFDDFANTKEEFMDFSPAYRLIQVINNVKYLAPMADVFLKGKVSLNPYFCLVSTNVEHLNAAKYSNEPESVLRRLYHVKVKPKDQYCVNGILSKELIEQHFGTTSCPDAWELTVRSYVAQNRRDVDLSLMVPVSFEGRKMVDIDVRTYLRWVQIASKKHFTEEGQYLANQEGVPTKCAKCGMVYCSCLDMIAESVINEMDSCGSSIREGSCSDMIAESVINEMESCGSNIREGSSCAESVLDCFTCGCCHEIHEECECAQKDAECGSHKWCDSCRSGIKYTGLPRCTHCGIITNNDICPCRVPYELCKSCNSYIDDGQCNCRTFVLEPNSGEWEYYTRRTWFKARADRIKNAINCASTSAILRADSICQFWDRFDCLPVKYVCHPRILQLGLLFWREDIQHSLVAGNSALILICSFLSFVFPCLSFIWIPLLVCTMYWFTSVTVQTYSRMVRDRILDLKDVVKTYTTSWQCRYAIIGLGAIGIVLALLRSRAQQRNVQRWNDEIIDSHTGLDPDSIKEIDIRDKEDNPWVKNTIVPLPMSTPSRTTTSSNLAASMKTNLIGIVSDLNKTTLGFYIVSNFLMVPTHFIKAHGNRDISVRCYKGESGKVGAFFKDKICPAFSIQIPNTDFTVCFVTGGGSMKDYRKFLPKKLELPKIPALLVTRSIMDSHLDVLPTYFNGSRMVAHTQSVFSGGYYTLNTETRAGMCMSPLLSDARGSTILGFHLGGKGCLGGCGTLSLDQCNYAIKELSCRDGVVLSASCGDLYPNMGDFPSSAFGRTILASKDVHKKSATNFLLPGACIDVYGGTGIRATPKSSVVPTMISEAVEEVFGVPQKWGPPKMTGRGNYPYQATLVHSSIPSLPVGSVLASAVRCMKNETLKLRNKLPDLFSISPLSRVETVSGIDGKKFIDSMNLNTSPGFPLSGSKHPFVVELDSSDYPNISCPRTFTPEIWDKYEDDIEKLAAGERCYAIWKSCLKDEATKTTKDKVRVFQSAPLTLQLFIRRYFLPIVRIIQLNPLRYECAVGVNAEGPEWQELWEAAMSKGKERILAGDYSKYDVRMPAQVVIAAFDILIDIAKNCSGYNAYDLHLMHMIVNEVVYPVMTYDGDLIQLFGTNPSGQNLTVIINSLVNSLLLRSCFYTKYPSLVFKEECSFVTYGDDVIGSVSPNCGDFTHITYAQWLSEHDMKFTMPDKESTPVHYMHEDHVDFLKRKSVFNPDLGMKVGLLSEDSIFKRLHSHLLSKELTLPMHSAQNIDSSLHDWFYYGREVFEDRRSKLREVAEKCNIEHMCTSLDISYDKRVANWRHKYLGEEEESEPELVLDTQCGDLYVSTVDYGDHCLGSAHFPFYHWETIAATCSIVCLPCLWVLLILDKVRFTIGFPRREWIYFLVMTTNGFEKWQGFLDLCYATLFSTFSIPLYYLIVCWVIKSCGVFSKH